VSRPRRLLAERLFERVRGPWLDLSISEKDCWLWLGEWRSRYGYGRIREGGDRSRCLQAHITLYKMLLGPVPPGRWLRHSCDTPLCCNPRHLQPGTAAENYADQVDRGRRPTRRAA
jgi:hypothetical protein